MSKLQDSLNYLIEEANNFNAGASWGTSTFANIIIEVVARYYETITDAEYSKVNRLYKNASKEDLLKMLEKEITSYQEQHPETCKLLKYFSEKI